MISWHHLDSDSSLETALSDSFLKDVILFKHSASCHISHMVRRRLEDTWDFNEDIIPYHLDLKKNRNISNDIAERFNVHHESPQILLIRNGDCIYDASHFDITVSELRETMKSDV